MLHSLKKQKGHAAILFALLIPGFYGLFALGIDGARAIQNRARLGDAAEVAALALSAQNSTSSQQNTALARLYVDAYISDKEANVPMTIVRTECQLTDQTQCEGGARYSQYDISITTMHEA
ncbi:pilus assembly protein, partial [Vibrio makurazakiensis]|uniref:TadE/TadG family type IV pilus assembly protein n=1 Tax=Vibrio makurazakiensis TaxID=2910250 RepID=UPI003D139146